MNDDARIGRRGLAAVALTTAAALAIALAPGSSSAGGQTKPKRKPKPVSNLVIAAIAIKQLPGEPPYITLDENSRGPGFEISVTTKNFGKAVGTTDTDLKLENNGAVIWHGRAHVAKLGSGDTQRHTWTIDNLKADPGFVEPVAIADATGKVDETNEHNVKSAPVIPVVPRDWKVDTFRTAVNPGGGVDETTQASSGFYYRLSRFDEAAKQFVYQAYGQVAASADFTGGGCAGHGQAQATQNPWPGSDSELVIKGNLSAYSAGVRTQDQPKYSFNTVCNGVSVPMQAGWDDLVTWVGTHSFPEMKFDATILQGEGTAVTPVGPATYTWDFVARISGV
jgi:hypothetical protein